MKDRFPARRHVASLFGLGFSLALMVAASACAPKAYRGGSGTENPEMDRQALSVTLDRDDITYLVDNYLKGLETSSFWQRAAGDQRPIVAIWPIQNSTTQHLDDQLLTLLSSIETSLVNTGRVRVVDRGRQAELADEIDVQQGSEFDPTTVQQLGRQLGVRYFFTGKITSVDERLHKTRRLQYSLFLQVVDVRTGAIEYQNEVTRSKELRG